MKKFLSLILVMVLCFSIAAPGIASAATVKITKTKLTLDAGKSFTLKITGTTKKVTWTSSSKSIATVSSGGIVKAIKAGTATITGNVSSKKYTCKVTVKEVFNAQKAVDNINGETSDLGDGVVAIIENDYSFPVAITVTAVFYGSDGEMLDSSTNSNSYFEKGSKCAMHLYGPYDDDYNNVAYSDYKVTFTVQATYSSSKSNVKDIEINANIGTDKVMAEVTNSGNTSCEFTNLSIVYYKDGNIIGYDDTYAEVEAPGSVDYLEFYLPQDESYNDIEFDDYEIYVNYSMSF